MRAIHLLAIPLTAGWLLGGCSSGSGLNNAGGTTSTAGGSAQGGPTAGAGGSGPGSVLASGGAKSVGGSTMVPVGGVAGSLMPAGGTTKTGGSSTTARSSTATGGGGMSTSAAGGYSASAGAAGASTSAGGSSKGGAVSSGSGTSRDAGAGDLGIVASGYCEGNAPKLTYQGQTISPAVTDFRGNIAMDCCNGYGVNLHSAPSLGFDVAIELVLSLSIFKPGEYDVGGVSSGKARALVFKDSDPLTSVGSVNSMGKLRIFGADGATGLPEFELCLEVTDTVSGLGGTRLYVPKVIIGSYQSDTRFQLFLLKDSNVGAGTASTQSLDALVLADLPVLDLGYVAYVEKATGKIGLNPGQKLGDSLRTRLGHPLEMPFVAVADGTRIYLGTFTSPIASMTPVGPFIDVEDITADSLILHAPLKGADPRNDERIINALSERGKLVP